MVHVTSFFDVLGGVSSIANLTAISYERLWSVCAPLKHRRYLTPHTVSVVLFFVWLYAIIVASSSVILWQWYWVTWFTTAAGFIFPLFLVIVAYFLIFVTVLRSPRNVISKQDNIRISKTICIIIGVFVACWAPFVTVGVLSSYCITFHRFIATRLWLRTVLKALHYANSCVNPIVYGIANAQYKEAYKLVVQKIVLTCLPKRNVTTEPPSLQTKPRDYARNYGNRPSSKQILCETHFIKDTEKSNTSSRDGSEAPYLPGDYRAIPVMGATAPDIRWVSAGSSESTNVLIKSMATMEGRNDETNVSISSCFEIFMLN